MTEPFEHVTPGVLFTAHYHERTDTEPGPARVGAHREAGDDASGPEPPHPLISVGPRDPGPLGQFVDRAASVFSQELDKTPVGHVERRKGSSNPRRLVG